MNKKQYVGIALMALTVIFFSCSDDEPGSNAVLDKDQSIIASTLTIDLAHLDNYAHQEIPDYITKDNMGNQALSDMGATLGRVLFYDKALSSDQTISCASCHKQDLAFSDVLPVSAGINGHTPRHSMRLINARFAQRNDFFWDGRAASLEDQTTTPIQDHIEMGFSGRSGDPDFNALIERLEDKAYYTVLFRYAFGSEEITEERIQVALAQFIRSIQSFDSKYDSGRQNASNDQQPFANFSTLENQGKQLFLAPPQFNPNGVRIGGGLGCGGCHRAPEFDIDPNTLSNAVIANATADDLDLGNFNAPSLRDLFNADGTLNGPLMHNGRFQNMPAVLDHYNAIPDPAELAQNVFIDRRLLPNNQSQRLNITADERAGVIAFIKTLSGKSVYNDPKWSDPFLK